MKETALARRILLAICAGTLLCVATGARAQPRPHATQPVITTGPRAWVLATTALLTYRNGLRIDRLSPGDRSDSSLARTRKILLDWWGVDSRSDLLQVLERLDREGHRSEFQKRGEWLVGMTETQYRRTVVATRDPITVRRMKLMRTYYQKHRRNSFIGWDYCRYIMLCRWGYMLGFLSEDEAWRRIMPAARTIQGGFGSWAELGEDYLVGREIWSHEEMEKTGQVYRDVQAWLVTEPKSPWNQLPWRMELEAGAKSSPR